MLNRFKFTLLVFLALICGNSSAQFTFEYNDSIKVLKDGIEQKFPWSGGLNYPQFSEFDYDYDGDLDLFIFDRSQDNIRLFSQENDGAPYYKFIYNSAALFPPNLQYRATLVDYNNDGKKDLFTYGIGGLAVYKNIGNAGLGLQWELAKDIVFSQYPGLYTSLFVSSSDIPAILDVDGDGDTDVLTFNVGGQYLEYHQNQSIENYGIPDSLEFILMNQCWGKFKEDPNTNSILLNDPNYPCQGGDIADPKKLETQVYEKHAGSTVLALDYDNSGVLDVLLGDVSFNNMNLLINGGSAVNTDSPMISVDPLFPSNSNQVNISIFPAAYWVDVDFDGKKDLLVAPNAKNVSENEKSVHFYKNTGSNTNPNFVYLKNDFLQENMIEHGSGSVPVLVDFNNDGLLDLFVSNIYSYYGASDKRSKLAYYQNTGTTSVPEYTLIDDDFLNLSTQSYGTRLVPTFGDIDNDNDPDLFLGRENGTLIYYENLGGSFGPAQFNYTDNLANIIQVGSFCHPQLVDLNGDLLLDLVLGKKNGTLSYYKNVGVLNAPVFELVSNNLGSVNVSAPSSDGYSSPHFFVYYDTLYLFVGGQDGKLHYYSDIKDNLLDGSSFTLEFSAFLGLDVDAYSSFYVSDVDNDLYLDLFVGQDLGGLFRLEVDPNSSSGLDELTKMEQPKVYQNPSSGIVRVVLPYAQSTTWQLYSTDGRFLREGQLEGSEFELDLTNYPRGIYHLVMEGQVGSAVVKVMKL